MAGAKKRHFVRRPSSHENVFEVKRFFFEEFLIRMSVLVFAKFFLWNRGTESHE